MRRPDRTAADRPALDDWVISDENERKALEAERRNYTAQIQNKVPPSPKTPVASSSKAKPPPAKAKPQPVASSSKAKPGSPGGFSVGKPTFATVNKSAFPKLKPQSAPAPAPKAKAKTPVVPPPLDDESEDHINSLGT